LSRAPQVPTRRIAVIAYHSSPLLEPGSGDAGGMTVYVRSLAKALADRGCHTDVFTRATSETDRPTFLGPHVRVVPITAGPRADVPKASLPEHLDEFVDGVRAFATMQRISYDVLHTHYWQSGVAGSRLSKMWSIPLVHSNHTLARVKNAALAPGETPEPESRIEGEHQVIDEADVLIASTDAEYQQLACLYGAAHDKLKVLPPGVDHELFVPQDRAAARKALGWEPEEPVLLYVGRIQPLKGIDLAIRALGHLSPPGARLVIVGGASGPSGTAEETRLRSLAEELGVSEQVSFVGPQPQVRLEAFYAASDLVVVCSHSESFGLTALEAHASGRPVVGTPVGGLAHIVDEGVTGYLVDDRDPAIFAERIAKVIGSPGSAAAMGRAAEKAARSFTWEATAASFAELYDCLINERFPELCTC
jgi:D-inositol-3-phosphate glycosyltransferase